MTRGQLAAGLAGAVAVVAAIASLALGWWSSTPSGGLPSGQLAVATSLSPRSIFFGDPVVATIEVNVNRAAVDPASVKVAAPQFDPYVETEPPTVTRHSAGPDEIIEYRYSLQCLADECLPLKGPNTVHFPATTVTALAGSTPLKAVAGWPRAIASSRLTPADAATSTAHFRRPAGLPQISYAVSPGRLVAALTILAVLLALVATALVGRELAALLARRRLGTIAQLTPLEAALLYTRQAATRPDPADRRKALGLLSDVLGDAKLADSAGDVAWAEEPPSPTQAVELADQVESAAAEQA